ncbi:uncharacterized protein LOC141726891 [Zonotrichia albicollis]|uniref:uncharacterized protein LOC141726891 n=1 Tax=Zonotrichia albicollis TaxID=44394 RepID=UPI003D80FA5D
MDQSFSPPSPLPGGWEWAAPPEPALWAPPLEARQSPPQSASRTPPRSEMGVVPAPEAPLLAGPPRPPPRPALPPPLLASWAPPRSEVGVVPAPEVPPGGPARPPLRAIPPQPLPAVLPLPVTVSPLSVCVPPATASPWLTPESAAEDSADPAPCLPPLSEPRDKAESCSRASPSFPAAEPLLLGDEDASAASGSAKEGSSPAPSVPPPLPPASPPPQAETVPVPDGAEDSAEPAGPLEQPAAAPTPSVISPLSVSGCPGAAPAAGTGEEGVSHSFHGAGAARQLGRGAVRLPAFKISILSVLGGVFSGIASWRLPSLPPLLHPSGGGQVGPESSAFGPQPSGGAAVRQMGDTPDAFALQRERAQLEETMACLLWETNISRPQMGFLGKASISLLLACLKWFWGKEASHHPCCHCTGSRVQACGNAEPVSWVWPGLLGSRGP